MTNLLVKLSQQPKTTQTIPNKQEANKKDDKKVKIASVVGSALGIAGAVAGVYALSKKGNPATTFMNLNYEEKDVLMVGAGAVLGGLTGGLLSDKDKNNTKPKLREATQQFFGNMVCPIGLLAVGNRLLDKLNIKMPNIKSASKSAAFANNAINYLPKVAMTVGALIGGMEIGNKIMNKVNNKLFKEEVKHDVHAEDYLVHADDLCLAANMILKDAKCISKVTSKILPATFIVAGSKTGMQKAE